MTALEGRPVVYAIAGSDCSGGAGVEADLATLRDMGVHGCSVVTALTAQNRHAVYRVTPTPRAQLRASLAVLEEACPADAVKIGMLGNGGIAGDVTEFIERFKGPVVCDPVLRASAGGAPLSETGAVILEDLLPHVSLLTPNRYEAEQLTGASIGTAAEVEEAARQLLQRGPASVLLTGGHLALDDAYCYDFFCSTRLSFWLRGERIRTHHTHGTGCTLASAIAGALARGYALEDAVVLGKMVVSHGLRFAVPLAGGSGTLAHGQWRPQLADVPTLWPAFPAATQATGFAALHDAPMGLYPVVDSAEWVEKLFAEGVGTVQLRIKEADDQCLRENIQRSVAAQQRHGGQLFINDYWQLAIECGAFGVHLGQEDLATADLYAIASAGLALGVSNHAWHELARAHAVMPSYMALGPIYSTTTKTMRFAPQGLQQLQEWVDTFGERYPLTAIGGIDQQRADGVAATGVGSIAVVRAITEAPDYRLAVGDLSGSLGRQAAAKQTAGTRTDRESGAIV